MIIHLLHNHFDKNHLENVKAEMLKLGTPTVRVYSLAHDMNFAIEGCHRLRAANELGITPNFIWLDANTNRAELDDLDCDYFDGSIDQLGDLSNDSLIFDI